MKSSLIWNVLSVIFILGICFIAGVVGMIFADPNTPLNPFPPETPVPVLVLPSSTPTIAVQVLPPTWTSTPASPQEIQPSSTARPTVTAVPSRTPFILPSPTKVPTNPFPTNARAPLAGRCKVTSQSPSDGTTYAKGTEFTTAWTIQNTSDATWDKENVDVKFQSGDAMHKSGNTLDLPQSVLPNESVKITITMTTPDTAGYHIATWNFSAGSKVLCTFYVEIFTAK